ncbi:hypothetical protein QYF61_020080 [Mycteria americana]|uniref:Uncharacterized protein n=1 Tax=Mycteria americana TaxID=33587 RepID=A0AAN7N6F8_MYCAM|nr:hypothetical protein QYF61_020080 [Mycteria americana]
MGPDGIHPTVLSELVEVFTKPLFIIYQQSWLTGDVPVDWRLANVTPIYKKGQKEDLGNYRPVSLTSYYGADHLERHHAARTEQPGNQPSQQGFMKGRSCLTNLISFYDKVTHLVDEGNAVDVVYLENKKAFGTISHSSPLEKLSANGLDGLSLPWWTAQSPLSSPARQWAARQDLPLSRDASQGYSSRLRDSLPQQILGPDPTNTPHSITSRVAYWAGGIDSMEQGEPSIIPIKSLSELSTAVTKAACIQAMHKRGSHDVPLSATVDFAMLKSLIRGAPAILKSHLVAKRDEIKKDTEHNEGLGDNAQNAHKQLPTWADLMHGIVNYSREMGWDDAPAEKQNLKPQGGDHKVRPIKRETETRSKGNKFKNPQTESREQRNELRRNALALGIPRAAIQGQPTGIILSLIEAFQKRDNGERKDHISTPPAPHPRRGDNPFLPLREELQDMKSKNE